MQLVNESFFVSSWAEASKKVAEIESLVGLPSYFGTGNPIHKPHMQVCYLEWGNGYSIQVKPEGDGYMSPSRWYFVHIT